MFSIKKVLIFSISSIILAGCSLNYGSEQNSESSVPEFSFTNATFNQYTDSRVTMQMNCDKLEQYKADGASFAKNAEFSTFDDDGVIDTKGSCELLSADSKNKKYTLFDNVSINIYSQEIELKATSLQFDGNSEQLTSGIADTVSVTRKGTTVSGKGFAASGVSKKYSFLQGVSGDVKDSENPVDDESEEELPEDEELAEPENNENQEVQ